MLGLADVVPYVTQTLPPLGVLMKRCWSRGSWVIGWSEQIPDNPGLGMGGLGRNLVGQIPARPWVVKGRKCPEKFLSS